MRAWRGKGRAAAGLVMVVTASAFSASSALAAPSAWLEMDGNVITDVVAPGVHDWANTGTGAANACPGVPGAVSLDGTGGIFNCGSPGAAGAPPNPPAVTPAAAADPSIISTTFAVDPLSSDMTACGVGDPTTFGGGLKNGDDINTFTFTTGNSPGKNDLGNLYAVSRIRADGHAELFFAAERLLNNGDSHMDFEFLQSKVTRTSGCSGTFAGHRTQGDLLVAVDFTNGGSLAGESVFEWHCNVDPGPQPVDGTICDPTGGAPHYELITPPAGALTFLVNAATISCGGWICRDSITGNSTQIADNDFMEGGIDLQVLPFTGCFNTVLPHTRTAQAFTSALTDFAGPLALSTCRAAAAPPGLPNTGLVAPDAPAPRRAHEVDVASARVGVTPPSRLVVPRLHINARVEGAGLDGHGNLPAPAALQDVVWYTGSSAPGQLGGTLISGHLGVRAGQAVFWDLWRLRPGDVVVILRSDGTTVRYVVDGAHRYPRGASVPELYANRGTAELWLITCDGRWDYSAATYMDRLVIHAQLLVGRPVGPASAPARRPGLFGGPRL